MASVHQSGWRYLQGISMALLCLLELPRAWAQRAEGGQQLPVLDAKKATGLLLNQTPPEYPALAKVNYIQGRVRVRLVVSAVGSVVEAHVLSGNPLLAAAVLDRVRMWRYRPYVAQGGSTSFETGVDVNFTLRIKKMDLAPTQAESDFRRQVKPPEVLARPEEAASTDPSVRLRLLVNAEGKVIDSAIVRGVPSLVEGARKAIERWSFRPARWGALSVPWYLEVDVPVYNAPSQAGTRLPSGR
jgi:TonB family protein